MHLKLHSFIQKNEVDLEMSSTIPLVKKGKFVPISLYRITLLKHFVMDPIPYEISEFYKIKEIYPIYYQEKIRI